MEKGIHVFCVICAILTFKTHNQRGKNMSDIEKLRVILSTAILTALTETSKTHDVRGLLNPVLIVDYK